MANTKYKYAAQLEAVHNQWCVDNGYPVRKRQARFPGRPKLQATSCKLQAKDLNADNSARFVKNAKRPV